MKKPILEIIIFDDGSTETTRISNHFFYKKNSSIRSDNDYNYDDYYDKTYKYLYPISNKFSASSSRISQIVLTVLYMTKLMTEDYFYFESKFEIKSFESYYTSKKINRDILNNYPNRRFNYYNSSDYYEDPKMFENIQLFEDYINNHFNKSLGEVSEFLKINTSAVRDKFDRQLKLKINDIIYLLIGFIFYEKDYFLKILYDRGVVESKIDYDKEAIDYMNSKVADFREKINLPQTSIFDLV